jgi:hypothetical protein
VSGTLSSNNRRPSFVTTGCQPPSSGVGQLKNEAVSMRFPRFASRWRDDKEPWDATAAQQLVELYRTAQRAYRLAPDRPLAAFLCMTG